MNTCNYLVLNETNMSNFHPLEVVSRCRNPQLQVRENYSYLFHLKIQIR